MGKADTALSIWYRNKRRFADLFNGALFQGRQLILAEDLELMDSKSEEFLTDKMENLESLQRYRDVVMRWSKGADLVLLACENQEKVHYAMPVRAMLYDALNYIEQIRKSKYKKEKRNEKVSADEYLSGLGKEDKLYPVIPLVVYYGTERWDGSQELHEMLQISEEYKSFVPNYKINLLDLAGLKDTNCFVTDLQKIFELLKYRQNKNQMYEYIRQEKTYFQSVDEETYNVICVFLNSKRKMKQFKEIQGQEARVDMCKALDDLYNEGVEAGIGQGLSQGLEQGIQGFINAFKKIGQSQEFTLLQLIEQFAIDKKTAEEYIVQYWS